MLIAQDGMLIAERRDVLFFFLKKIPCFLNSSVDFKKKFLVFLK